MRSLSLALVLFVCLAPAAASAQTPAAQQLETLRAMTFEARFDDAIRGSRELLARTDLSATDRNAALEILATAQIARRQREDAEATLELLYRRDPGHRLTDADASPPVISAFARAREARPDAVTVRLEHQPPTPTRREPPPLEVQIVEGADAVAEVRLIYRVGGEGDASVVMTAREGGTYLARIPLVGDPSSALDVAYHVVAFAPSMTPLGGLGSPAEPLSLRVPPEAAQVAVRGDDQGGASRGNAGPDDGTSGPRDGGGGDVTGEWWFWTLIAAVVIGAGVTTGIVLGTSSQGPEAGTLGTARLGVFEF